MSAASRFPPTCTVRKSSPRPCTICKADLLLKGEGEVADNIVGEPEHSTLANDAFPSRKFDFMLSNPPCGKTWKADLERMDGKKGIRDPRFLIEYGGDLDFSLVTRSSDGQMLFLANMLSKMKQDTKLGNRIAEVHNGSSLFTGDAGQGESNIRRWIIESDWPGRGLIDFDPEADAGKGDCGEEVSCELVMAGRDASEVLELVEEAFDEVALAVQVIGHRALLPAVPLGRDVGARAMVSDGVPGRLKAVKEGRHGSLVGGLARSEHEAARQAKAVDDDVDFGAQPASRASDGVIRTPFFPPAACWWAHTTEASRK